MLQQSVQQGFAAAAAVAAAAAEIAEAGAFACDDAARLGSPACVHASLAHDAAVLICGADLACTAHHHPDCPGHAHHQPPLAVAPDPDPLGS